VEADSAAPSADVVSIRSSALFDTDTMRPIGRGRRRVPSTNGTSSASSSTGDAFLVCDDVHKSYHGVPVLKGVSLSVDAGEVVVLMGPSGSGQSTLLRLVMHLETLDDGEIKLDGEHIGYDSVNGVLRETRNVSRARADAGVAMVFQQFNLFEHLPALDNVTVALRHVYRIPKEQAEQRGLDMLAAVGLRSHAGHRPAKLSGGQQQRVAIARALATHPRLMLLDEPTSALDPELIGEVRAVIRGLAQAGMTMLVVTHDVAFAREIADRVVVLQNGVIADQGPADSILRDPARAETRQFFQLLEG
jgi:polar amino acid transport system permease protein